MNVITEQIGGCLLWLENVLWNKETTKNKIDVFGSDEDRCENEWSMKWSARNNFPLQFCEENESMFILHYQ
jgi:hypothetical protein